MNDKILDYGYNLGILKVSLGKKMMFVKIEDVHKAENRVLGAKLMEAFLKKQGGEVNGFRVKVAPLSVAHDFLLEKLVHTIYATDFYPKKDFEQVENMTDAIGNKANATLKIIRKEIQQRFPKHNIFEINGLNALCNQKTKTLILYDLRAQ